MLDYWQMPRFCKVAPRLVFGLGVALLGPALGRVWGQTPQNVLIVVNDSSPVSRIIGEYYARRREVPMRNICRIRSVTEEGVPRALYDKDIAAPIAGCLKNGGLVENILYIVTTQDVPLRISGTEGLGGEEAAVDSELTLLYSDITRRSPHPVAGSVPNPFFGHKDAKFAHPQFPIYLVTRLAAYSSDGVKAIIDRSLKAENRGNFVIDLAATGNQDGDNWLRAAADLLPKNRVVLDETTAVLRNQKDVIGYASWGSNDKNRHDRFLGFQWLPGAIMTEFVSTNGRTFKQPPSDWNISAWTSPKLFFFGSPQTMTADYILEGATGASGHVDEPYLNMTPRPELLLPAYYSGRNLAESYYLAIPRLSWQNIVVGDPLCSLGKP
jgi:uncharacterized protein (TIGR03790 family)